ncbi:hypothetical protein RFI_24222 [Reticulomyxa filosa]|uniref:RGS domain-containing protein n=1 Tax=Reticulomyxa filosa TaxID=46433 RepID=X6MGK8_RETFI|nr:hypothetical protein RFI_24222 [Reticulomyxa filosa]|eukprot:ETO13153.1 hypothetical protein RFI_24222 [Reticulomyxa filosa]
MIWVALLGVGLIIFPQHTYERQLCLMSCMAGLHSINGIIMLRPKSLYYKACENGKCRWNCLSVRKCYVSELTGGQNRSFSDLRTKSKNGSKSRSRETSGNRHAIEMSYQITLEEILSQKLGFELFVSHLVRELSLENVLFLVEYMQLKHFIVAHQLHTYIQDIGYRVPIYSNLLQKSLHPDLLQANMPVSTALLICFDMFRYLYSHYIANGAVALLNLAFESSSSISRQMLELKQNPSSEILQSLLCVFDGAARDIVRLLRGDSFYRFQLSKECIKYCEELL